MLENCCVFTGHRPHKFPWKYDETDSRCVALKAVLAEQIATLANAGFTQFLSGDGRGHQYMARPLRSLPEREESYDKAPLYSPLQGAPYSAAHT